MALCQRLSARAVYERFFSFRRLLPEEARAFANVDYRRRMAVVAEVDDGQEPTLIGVARYGASDDGTTADIGLPPALKDGIDPDAVDGAVQLLYDIPAIQVEHVRHEEPVLNTGFWRGVGVTHNNFVSESFMDELADASRQDPVAFRPAVLGKSPRAMAVLDLAAKEAGPLPRGHGRGVALLYGSWSTYLAQIAEVEVTGSGDVRVHRIVCAVDCGRIVNPDIVRAQIESGIVYGISGALWGEVTLKNGRVEQSNFHNYRVLRTHETPPIEVHLVRNSEAPGGIGEPGTAVTAPALGNAIYAATGKRLRKLPLQPGLALAVR